MHKLITFTAGLSEARHMAQELDGVAPGSINALLSALENPGIVNVFVCIRSMCQGWHVDSERFSGGLFVTFTAKAVREAPEANLAQALARVKRL